MDPRDARPNDESAGERDPRTPKTRGDHETADEATAAPGTAPTTRARVDPGTSESSDVSWVEASAREAVGGAPKIRLGAYVVERELGRGGQGAVYLARDERLGRRVALKVLGPSFAATPDALRRFEAEARTLASLDHPGLCAVYEAAEADGVRFIAMRYVEGRPLHEDVAERRAKGGGAPPKGAELARRLRFIEVTAFAFHAAHEAGVVHRDLKPGNVVVDADGAPVVLDFGLARALDQDDEESRTATGTVLGTPAYMAPEQARGDVRAIDRRTDVYALGVVLYELLADARPFDGSTAAELLAAVLNRPTPDPRKRNPAVTQDLAVVVAAATAKAANDRYPTALAFADDVRRARRFEPVVARPVSLVGRAWRWTRRRPGAAALSLAMLALIATSGVFFGLHLGDRDNVARLREREAEDFAVARVQDGFMGLLSGDRAGFSAALAAFDAAETTRPGRREIAYGRALAHLVGRSDLARPESALAAIDAFVARHGTDGVLLRLRADALERLGRGEEAAVARAAATPPGDDVAYFVEALRLERLGDFGDRGAYDRAVDALETAIHLSPVRRDAYFHWFVHLVGKSGRVDSARRAAGVARILSPGPSGERAAGFALSRAAPEEALAAFERADPEALRGREPILQGMAHTFLRTGRGPEALRATRRLVELRPDDATQHFNLAIVEDAFGDRSRALASARRAAELRPDVLEFLVAYGGFLRTHGADASASLVVLDKALAVSPECVPATIERAAALVELDRAKEALDSLDAVMEAAARSEHGPHWARIRARATAALGNDGPATRAASRPDSRTSR
jgi:serine/threonine protein kinase